MKSEGNDTGWAIEFLAWLEVNKQRLAVIVVVAGVLASVVAIVQWRANERELAAQAALQGVYLQSGRGELAAPIASADYLRVAAEWAGTHAAANARLLAAGECFREGKYTESRSEFEAAGAQLRDPGLKAAAAFGIAACLDALGQTSEALAGYQDVTVRYATTAVAPQARLEMAELLETSGELAQALQAYDEVANRPDSLWADSAREMREALISRHPELAPKAAEELPADAVPSTNAPVVSS